MSSLVCLLIVVHKEAHDGWVISKLNDNVEAVLSTVISEQEVQEETEHTALWCACVRDQ